MLFFSHKILKKIAKSDEKQQARRNELTGIAYAP